MAAAGIVPPALAMPAIAASSPPAPPPLAIARLALAGAPVRAAARRLGGRPVSVHGAALHLGVPVILMRRVRPVTTPRVGPAMPVSMVVSQG